MDITTVEVGIRRVKLIGYYVDELLYRGQEQNHNLNLLFQHVIKTDESLSQLTFTLRAFYSYTDSPDNHKLLDFHVENCFFINGLTNFIAKNEKGEQVINLTDNAWAIIVGLSVSHLRGFLSHNVAGTVYKDFIIPIIDPIAFYKGLFNIKLPVTE